ncbi:hypothetical protein [Shimia aestuarii]|uniref:Uncharacterized protein n=1 Tax=Shimia aestuarii TaxID=254406 RepID=A0A1I4S5B2_9RHOB|nr:hypothetical protein [Shimia aestuarii]SFM59695.1 hypothetical protein SAMN04488042_1109 [Shimia aestuarii]
MSFLQNILFLALTLSLSWFVTFAVARILHRRDPGPVLSLNRECDSGIVAGLRDLLRAQPTECEPGVFQSRPSIGMRVIAPLCALLFLALTDMTPVLNATGVEALGLGTIVKTVICLGFGYLWYMLLFQQRVAWGHGYITAYGLNLTWQCRRLEGLTDIKPQASKPVLVMSFEDQAPLCIPKYLAHRTRFLQDMQEIAHDNANNGAIVPWTLLRAQKSM